MPRTRDPKGRALDEVRALLKEDRAIAILEIGGGYRQRRSQAVGLVDRGARGALSHTGDGGAGQPDRRTDRRAHMSSTGPKERSDQRIGWGSDIAAEDAAPLCDIPISASSPARAIASACRSLVNRLGNERPGILLCLHEDHSVAVAHSYARVPIEPMACVLHANVRSAAWHEWDCSTRGAIVRRCRARRLVRSLRKSAAPGSIGSHHARSRCIGRRFREMGRSARIRQSLVESLSRANLLTRSNLRHRSMCVSMPGFGSQARARAHWPDLARFAPPCAAASGERRLGQSSSGSLDGARPGHPRRARLRETSAAWDLRIRLAERLGACVMSDLKSGAMFPTDHPAHVVPLSEVLNHILATRVDSSKSRVPTTSAAPATLRTPLLRSLPIARAHGMS